MKRVDLKTYREIYEPKLNRRQQIAFDGFYALNREREYINTGVGTLPVNIKKAEIKRYWDDLTAPIAFNFFLLFIQSLDDVFITHNTEQARANTNG